jgi:glycosyltransferase involved in cell wall biosynthesis
VNEQTLQSRVHFAGNRDDAPAWLAAMDIFVLPSYGNEGVPQGIMQAMACGLPVIATPVGAVREAVLDGVTGRLTTPRNIAELCGHLIDLMRDAPLRESLGHAAWRHAQAHFGIDVMIDRMLEVFGAAVARHRQGRDA